MPYDKETRRITAPVGVHDVRQATGSTAASLVRLTAAADINPWAKHKPVRLTGTVTTKAETLATLDVQWTDKTRPGYRANGWKGRVAVDAAGGTWTENGMRFAVLDTGLTMEQLGKYTDRYGATMRSVYKIDDGTAEAWDLTRLEEVWSYVRADVARLTDWAGYWHLAPAPMSWTAAKSVTVALTDDWLMDYSPKDDSPKDGPRPLAWGFLTEYKEAAADDASLALTDFGPAQAMENSAALGLVLYVRTSKGHFLVMEPTGAGFTRFEQPLYVPTDLLTMTGDGRDDKVVMRLLLGAWTEQTSGRRLLLTSARFTAVHETVRELTLTYVGKMLKVVYHVENMQGGSIEDGIEVVRKQYTGDVDENEGKVNLLLKAELYANAGALDTTPVDEVIRMSGFFLMKAELRNPYGVTLPPHRVTFEYVMEDEVHDYETEMTPTVVLGRRDSIPTSGWINGGTGPEYRQWWQSYYFFSNFSAAYPCFDDPRNNEMNLSLYESATEENGWVERALLPLMVSSASTYWGRYDGPWEMSHVRMTVRLRVRAIVETEGGDMIQVTSVPVNGNGKTDYRLDGEYNRLRKETVERGEDEATARRTLDRMNGTGGYLLTLRMDDTSGTWEWRADYRNGTYYHTETLTDGSWRWKDNGWGTAEWLPWAHRDDEGDKEAARNFADPDLYR